MAEERGVMFQLRLCAAALSVVVPTVLASTNMYSCTFSRRGVLYQSKELFSSRGLRIFSHLGH